MVRHEPQQGVVSTGNSSPSGNRPSSSDQRDPALVSFFQTGPGRQSSELPEKFKDSFPEGVGFTKAEHEGWKPGEVRRLASKDPSSEHSAAHNIPALTEDRKSSPTREVEREIFGASTLDKDRGYLQTFNAAAKSDLTVKGNQAGNDVKPDPLTPAPSFF